MLLFQESAPFSSPVLVSFAIPRTQASARENGASDKLDVRFRLDVRKMFFTVRVLSHWNRLSKEVMGPIYLKLFKAWLDGTLSNMIWWVACLPMVVNLELDDF